MVKINQKGNYDTSYKIISHVTRRKCTLTIHVHFLFFIEHKSFLNYTTKGKMVFVEFLSPTSSFEKHILATNHANNWYYSKSFSYPIFHVKICIVMLFGYAERILEKGS